MSALSDPRTTWWFWRPVQDRLTIFTQALLRPLGHRYTVILRPVGTGYHDPAGHVIHANPILFPAQVVAAQFRATQGLLTHEAAHALFTEAWPEAREDILCETVNILEDQRIENAIEEIYPGIVPALRLLGDLMWAQMKTAPSEPAWQALACCLAWRWAHARTSEKMMLAKLKVGEKGRRLWAIARPRVESAWESATTTEVIAIARELLAALGLPLSSPIPDWLTRLAPPTGVPVSRASPAVSRGTPIPDSPSLGGTEVEPTLAPTYDTFTQPAPYLELENAAGPLARRLAEALKLPDPRASLTPHAWRGHFSPRQNVRTPETAFVYRNAPGRSTSSLALHVLVDRSGSMDVLAERVRLALMSLYLAATALRIPIGISAFGADHDGDESALTFSLAATMPAANEPTKSLLAGYRGVTACEFLDWGLGVAERELQARSETRKVVLIIHDGQPVYDGALGRDWDLAQRRLRSWEARGLHTIGLYLGSAEDDQAKLRELFPRLIVSSADNLAEKLGDVLRALVV
jgi:hypothetical protein